MSVQVCSASGQTEGRRYAFFERTNKDLPSKISLTYGFNVSYYKSVHHPIPNLPVKIGNILAIVKTNL